MSHLLPPTGHPLRETFDVSDVVAIATGERPVHCSIPTLRRHARETFAANPAARRVYFFNLDPSNDQLRLISFGRRLAWRKEWTFGPITRATRLA